MTAFTQVLLSSHSFQAMGAARRDPRRGEIPVRSASYGSVVARPGEVVSNTGQQKSKKSKFRTMAAGVIHRLPHYQGGHNGKEKSSQMQSAVPRAAAVRQVPEEAHESRRR